MKTIIGVRFRPVGKIYYFEPDGESYELGDGVIVETARGVEFGKIAILPKEVDDTEVTQPLKQIIRKADERDYAQLERNRARRAEAMAAAKEKIARHKLDMKLVDAEFTFDDAKVIFYFTSDNRVDFRELVKDLASYFRIRIELRQIGIRDETKMKGGLGPCGRPCCCASYLTDFTRVSIKMAKTQGLSLNPGKISGLCGRLMCCLAYENEHYAASSKLIPPVGAEVQTPDGKGRVVSVNLLKLTGRVKLEKEGGLFEFKEYPASDLKGKKAMLAEERENPTEEEDGFPEEFPEANEKAAPERVERKKEGADSLNRPEPRRKDREEKKDRREGKKDRPKGDRRELSRESRSPDPRTNRSEPSQERPNRTEKASGEFKGGFVGHVGPEKERSNRTEKASGEFKGGFVGHVGAEKERPNRTEKPSGEFRGGFIGRAEKSEKGAEKPASQREDRWNNLADQVRDPQKTNPSTTSEKVEPTPQNT